MASLLAPAPAPSAEKNLGSREDLALALDDLLERYLNLLDQYQKLQQVLNKHLSSGYLSLAQANFSNPNRIRYSSDYYDDRMQASTVVYDDFVWALIECDSSLSTKHTNSSLTQSSPPFSAIEFSATDSTKTSKTDDIRDEKASKATADSSEHLYDGHEKGPGMPRDPLKWFGILVPPALRASQRSFKLAAMDTIPALASITNEMKEVEIEVRRARKKLRKAKQNGNLED